MRKYLLLALATLLLFSTDVQGHRFPNDLMEGFFSSKSKEVTPNSKESTQSPETTNSEEVTLIIAADGATKQEAINNALRNAISQAYGVFVSANTTLLNDELVKDEFVTLTNGNIKNYEEIADVTLPNGTKSVTLKATVCISKLVSYAKSKGASTEFAGAAFAMNMKMKELNKENELKALRNLRELVGLLLPSCYDLECTIGDVRIPKKNLMPDKAAETYEIPITVSFIPNDRAAELQAIIEKTLKNLELDNEELKEYKRINLSRCCMIIYSTSSLLLNGYDSFLFRNSGKLIRYELLLMTGFAYSQLHNFVLSDNNGNVIYYTVPNLRENCYDFANLGDVKDVKLQCHTNEVLPFSITVRRETRLRSPWSSYEKPLGYGGSFHFDFPHKASVELYMQIPQSDISKYSNFKVEQQFDKIDLN